MFDAGRLPPLREVAARHGIEARKSLGQHFLFDLNLTRRIVSAAGDLSGVHVVEVGAGPGGLTRALLESNAAQVHAIERDARAVAALRELAEASNGRLTVIEADALAFDVAGHSGTPRRLVANLPYNAGTQMLVNWLGRAESWLGFTLMFQKEVAERLVAQPGSKAYGRLSVLTQWLCEARIMFDVPASAFVPPPNVTSSVVNLSIRPRPLAPARREALETVTRAAFGQRRKMLRRSLSVVGGGALLEGLGIPGEARAEELSVEQFCAIARAVDQAGIVS